MTEANPYRTPDEVPAAPSDELTIGKGLRIVAGIAGLFGVMGALLGLSLGVVVPSYYRTVFGAGDDPSFVPWQVGFGLGLTQGLISGAVTGGLVVLAVAWYRSRKRRNR